MTFVASICGSDSCGWIAFSRSPRYSTYPCPTCGEPASHVRGDTLEELRTAVVHRLNPSDQAAAAALDRRLDQAQRDLEDRDVAKRWTKRASAIRTGSNQPRQHNKVVTALCRSCGVVVAYRKWPERHKKHARKGRSPRCDVCHEHSVLRLPSEGSFAGPEGMVDGYKSWGEEQDLAAPALEDLLRAASDGFERLEVREQIERGELNYSDERPWVRAALANHAKRAGGNAKKKQRQFKKEVTEARRALEQNARRLGAAKRSKED